MERLDFSSIMTTIRTYISEDHTQNQVDFLYWIFNDFMLDDNNIDFDFDSALVCRWMTGQSKISPRISSYYLERNHQITLYESILQTLIPKIYDKGMVAEQLHQLLMWDNTISNQQKGILDEFYPYKNDKDLAKYICNLFCFAMQRTFIKRDAKTKALLANNTLSPVLADFIINASVPAPCRYFCGRDEELQKLHDKLQKHGKIFLQGIAGIGKSELAKFYAKQYKKEYTNILYLTYTGDLMQDIIDLDFIDDTEHMADEERFKKHNRFLRSLKSDTLLIIDNFNVTATKDSILDVVLKYKCNIIFTTRSIFENFHSMQLNEISDSEMLLSLMGHYYSETSLYSETLTKIIETVHFHTLAIELSARLL
ncbi:NB-ARC domain-containing protein, partial [Thomasclavelia sp.]